MPLIDLFFPPICVGCARELPSDSSGLCGSCSATVPELEAPRCPHCAARLPAGILNRDCRTALALHRFFAVAPYRHPMVRAAIDAFKYESVESLAVPLATLLKRSLETALPQARNPLLVPIPMHERRLRSRGFNQAALLARVLGALLHLPENEQILARSRDTDQQAKLPHAARAENIRGAFAAIAEEKLDASSTIILIDDVATTGATMKEAAVTLHRAGAREIWGTAVSYG